MSDNKSDDNKIIIKFEIQVPVGTSGVSVQGPQAPSGPTVPKIAGPEPISPAKRLSEPVGFLGLNAPNNPANVKVVGTNTRGEICATASNESFEGNPPSEVWLKVLARGEVIPDSPPSDALPAVPDGESGSLSSWHHYALPNAVCAVQATGVTLPLNRLAVWRKFSGEWHVEVKNFKGRCTNMTDCDDLTRRKGVGTYPRAWRLERCGFSGALASLNDVRTMAFYPESAEGYVAWLAGGDGVTQPRAEFFGKSCGCEPFELRLSCGGQRLVYHVPRDQFNPSGVNRLTWVSEYGAPSEGNFPTTLQIVPA